MIVVLTSVNSPPLLSPPEGLITQITPADLSRPGWRWDPQRPNTAELVTDAGPLALNRVSAVFTCLAAVTPSDLPHVADADRSFVAAEMTAFLLGWLHALQCPVLNAPSVDCLAGAGLRRAEWVVAAERVRIPTAPRLPALLSGPTVRVGVAGERHVSPNAAAGESARRLADELEVELLAPVFATGQRDPVLLDVTPWWRAPELGVAAALEVMRTPGARQ